MIVVSFYGLFFRKWFGVAWGTVVLVTSVQPTGDNAKEKY